ncbi:MAG TPA: class I SAM-dependent methyltransferase [Solirubrobacteraceae bacterium]
MPPRASLAPYAGNAYDKYVTRHPVERRLVSGFLGGLDDLWEQAGGAGLSSILDVGCGEGRITGTWARRIPHGTVVGLDRPSSRLDVIWRARAAENLRFVAGDATALPFGDGAFELVSGVELLEQVSEPERALAELTRVARRWVLVSVPREPVWRALNVARGAYVRWLGNPPGHVNHWSRRAFTDLAGRHAPVAAVRTPFPWTMVLLRVPAP